MRRYTLIGLSLSLLAHAGIAWWAWRTASQTPSPAPKHRWVLDLASIQVARAAPPAAEPVDKAKTRPKPEPPAPLPPEPPSEPLATPPPPVRSLARVTPPRKRRPRHKHHRPRHPARRLSHRIHKPQAASPSPEKPVSSLPARARPVESAPAATTTAMAASAVSPAEVASARASYRAALLAALRKHKFYPRRALRRGREGTVKVGFEICADGRIENVRLLASSGVHSLDQAALRVPRALGRFEPLPKALGKSRWKLEVPLSYRIR